MAKVLMFVNAQGLAVQSIYGPEDEVIITHVVARFPRDNYFYLNADLDEEEWKEWKPPMTDAQRLEAIDALLNKMQFYWVSRHYSGSASRQIDDSFKADLAELKALAKE